MREKEIRRSVKKAEEEGREELRVKATRVDGLRKEVCTR